MDGEDYVMCEDCLYRESKLTVWEAGFLQDLMDRNKPLTPKQKEVLDRIWERVT